MMSNLHPLTQSKLRRERSEKSSGNLVDINSIPALKEKDYYILDEDLDGDAPKKLIKVYRYEAGSCIRRDRLRTWTPYIAKSAEKWYPHESVIEYFINRAGQEMNLPMNEVALLRINGQVRFLSKFFLAKGDTLIHGAEICGDYMGNRTYAAEIANDRKKARDLFTFGFVKKAIESVFPDHSEMLINDLVKVFIFDALLGNNDRHFYNWAVIRPVRRGSRQPKLAPIYDSARGMCWNHSEDSVVKWLSLLDQPNWKKYDRYLTGASPRFSLESDKEVNHFEFIQHLCQLKKSYLSLAKQLSSQKTEAKVSELLNTDFATLFSPKRRQLMTRIIHDRFATIRSITSNL
jgi:hypothetical protein